MDSKAESQGGVAVVGEALIDIIETDDANTETVGGSPANVAIGLARQGVDTRFLTHFANDERGQRIRQHLVDAGVRLEPGSMSSERTSVARATIATDGAATYDFDLEWSLPHSFDLGRPRLIHCGSVATFLESGASDVREILVTRESDILATYDPNIRPSIIGRHSTELDVFEQTAALCDVVKLSDEDGQWLYPGKSSQHVLDRLLCMGPSLVAMTLGARGSMLMTERATVVVPTLPGTVVDTIGAGDTYMASLVFSLLSTPPKQLREDDLRRIGHRAATAAAITISREGADLPTLTEINTLLLGR